MKEFTKEQVSNIVKEAIRVSGKSIRSVSAESNVGRTIIYKILKAENYEITPLMKLLKCLNVENEFKIIEVESES